jgi:NitT/TauT family transport system substrate-binding protein
MWTYRNGPNFHSRASLRWPATLALTALLLAACGGSGDSGDQDAGESGSSGNLIPVTVQFTWLPNPGFAPVLLAKERGYFEDEGLDVTINAGGGSISAPQLLVSGKADIAVGAVDDVPAGIGEGLPLVSLAVMERYSTSAVIVAADSPIMEPADLAGKEITTAQFDASGNLLPAFLSAVGVDPDSVKVNTVDAQAKVALLTAGKVEAITGFTRDEAVSLEIGADFPVRTFSFAEAGVRFPSTGIFTTRDIIDEKPQVIGKLVRALLRGYADGVNEPEAAVAAAAKAYPDQYGDMEVAEEHARRFATQIKDFLPEEGLGYQSEEDWEATQDLLVKYFGLTEERPVSEYYTNEFLPEEDFLG